ncbi:hypothetical protein QQF45_17375 [Halopseudomonas aestusnigri]|uniref:hypothetical protein n=1 Tax=Halopseudomonas aestusnigri TaxID=857252 RepID=UPI002552A22D|nr:hypothetical protein [Halopseudomonas aestusnigri]MDL2200815.1 hypothetical protein [Halopseudomonas aestusnigri]
MLKFVDNYLQPLTLAEGATAASLTLPDGEYVLTLADSQSAATRWEIVRAVVTSGAAVLTRGQQGTTDQAWPAGSVIYCALTADTLNGMLSWLTELDGIATGPLTIIEELPSTGDLPASGAAGDAYLIGGHIWVWATGAGEWADAGSFEGEPGEPGAPGDDGRAAEFRASATHVQWRLVGDPTWIDLLPLSELAGADGADGRDPEFQASATHLQYRLTGDTEWVDLLPLSSLQGPAGDNGREIELQASATHIQYRYTGDPTWTDLIALSALKGDQGDAGVDGADGVPAEFQASATHVQWRLVGSATWIDLVPLSEIGVSAGGWDTLATPAISAGALTLDLSEPSLFAVTLDQNITTLSFANLPAGKAPAFAVAFTQDATGGRTVAWPASVIGTPPDIGAAAGDVTVVSLAYIGGGNYVISGAIYA